MALASFSKRICTDILSSHSLNPYSPLCNTICRSISRQPRYLKEVGLPDFLKAVGNGVEAHSEKLANEVGDLQKLLETRTMTLKKLGIPCKHRKLILRFTQKYRLGLWRPRPVDLQK
uniref:Small ribosomal subunit protein mS41 SAM domain-containing protein n=1 Tax=Picea sitchensis TaxID=3332 RepID=A9NYC5_PICSI|nr:unknown [Picea sitchensis]